MSLNKIRKLAQVFPGEIGVYAKNLITNEELSYNADVPFYLASVSKVLIMIGAVDLMDHVNRLDDSFEVEMYDYREESKRFKYHHIGTQQTYRELLRQMIRNSDTTATDMIVRIAGLKNINQRLDALGIDGISPITSIGELDHIVWSKANDKWASVPAYALESETRTGNTDFLIPYYLDSVPESISIANAFQSYYRTGLNSATPRAMGKIAERIAEESLLNVDWKNDALRNKIFKAASEGQIGQAIPAARIVDTKGGAKYRVQCVLGISYNAGVPEAVIGVFTQNLDIPRDDANAFIREAANLAYRAVGFSHSINTSTQSGKSIRFTEPSLGHLFDIGATPNIGWKSNDINGRLTLSLVRNDRRNKNETVRTISTNMIANGSLDSFNITSDIAPGSNYRFKLSSNTPENVEAYSSYFAIRGVIRLIMPTLGMVINRGDTPKLSWETRGVNGRLTIELFRGNTRIKTVSSNAVDDGEWHSWTVADNLERDDNYQIKITSNNDPSVVGFSQHFTIGGEVQVTSPSSGQIFNIGDTPTLRWSTENVSGNVEIALFRGETDHQHTIHSNANNDGEWRFAIQLDQIVDGLGYRVQVTDKADSDIYGTSQYFQIGSRFEWLVPSVEQAPFDRHVHARKHYFPYGHTPTLRWRTIGNLEGNVRISLVRNGVGTIGIISHNANNDGEWHSWVVPNSLPAASDYQLQLTSLDRAHVKALSQPFHLGALIDITRPYNETGLSPTDTLKIGSKPRIKWRTENIAGKLKLELLNLNEKIKVIASNAVNDGEWKSWTVSDDIEPDDHYRFRLTSKSNPGMSALSPWFSIEVKDGEGIPS